MLTQVMPSNWSDLLIHVYIRNWFRNIDQIVWNKLQWLGKRDPELATWLESCHIRKQRELEGLVGKQTAFLFLPAHRNPVCTQHTVLDIPAREQLFRTRRDRAPAKGRKLNHAWVTEWHFPTNYWMLCSEWWEIFGRLVGAEICLDWKQM
jgi:hypothetical protein